MRITAIVNQKGGVGKTATTINLGGALADAGADVLLVDLDPQGHLTRALKVSPGDDGANLATALTGKSPATLDGLAVKHSEPSGRLDVLPHSPDMFDVARELDKLRGREHRLERLMGTIQDTYDHVLIDCPPALDILTDNALTTADGVVIPVQAEDSSLHALELLLEQIAAIEEAVRDEPLTLHGLVVSMLERGRGGQARSTIGRTVIQAFEAMPLPILASVPRGVPVTEAWRVGQTVTAYAPASEHAAAYRALAKALEGA